ncbi:hypothetical protein, variant [Sphaeroforma arctica JP610]|uniref:Uncharacterized protein n=1 Tax=Sphaeroforma arctica JP610 TaxID=667725 RepID=A0A0L0FF87_9EUKA|nr:hypothetical protein, variant [Sphaeroforma arctica JP610]KNC75439.1 hypothetical protein, variant [Sphaeroforma arctica JP610]|eukprot:XP_014149341.1 hypothetical protein, variant [Sphaeroforma arctica JP610]
MLCGFYCSKAELGQPIDDLALMEKINNITAARYSKMADQMANVNAEVAELYDAYTTVAVSMEKIDEVEQGNASYTDHVYITWYIKS